MPARPLDENVVTVQLLERGEREVAIEVHDNGVGIAADRLERIFDPFYTTKSVGEGTGLGLAVCQGIVRALGGRIEVESEVGRGTSFRVVLSRADGEADAARLAPASPALAGRRVLVIDDEPLVRRSVARTLRAAGCEVIEAEGGREGLARASSEPQLDAVLCDLMMPEVHGMDVFRAIERERPELAARVAFLSGGAVTEEARAFLASSKQPYLEKPFSVADLRATITAIATREAGSID